MTKSDILVMLNEGSKIVEFFGIRKTTYNIVEEDGSKWKITSAQFRSHLSNLKVIYESYSGFTKREYKLKSI